MSHWYRTAWGLALMSACLAGQATFADGPAEKEEAPKEAEAKPKKKQPKAAQNKTAIEAIELNLDAVAAPLRNLFGGGIVAEMANAPNAAAENQALIQQFQQQLRPVMMSELRFVRLMCGDLTLDQRRTIKRQAEASLTQAAKQMSHQQVRQQRGQAVARNKLSDGPRKLIRNEIANALKGALPDDRVASYTAAAELRSNDIKQAAILSVVSLLDGQVNLTSEQREKISDSIAAKWQDDSEKWLLMSQMYADRYFPTGLDQAVVPHLNASQKSVWQGIQKIDVGWWDVNQGQAPEDDGWWGFEPGNQEGPAIFNFEVLDVEVPEIVR